MIPLQIRVTFKKHPFRTQSGRPIDFSSDSQEDKGTIARLFNHYSNMGELSYEKNVLLYFSDKKDLYNDGDPNTLILYCLYSPHKSFLSESELKNECTQLVKRELDDTIRDWSSIEERLEADYDIEFSRESQNLLLYLTDSMGGYLMSSYSYVSPNWFPGLFEIKLPKYENGKWQAPTPHANMLRNEKFIAECNEAAPVRDKYIGVPSAYIIPDDSYADYMVWNMYQRKFLMNPQFTQPNVPIGFDSTATLLAIADGGAVILDFPAIRRLNDDLQEKENEAREITYAIADNIIRLLKDFPHVMVFFKVHDSETEHTLLEIATSLNYHIRSLIPSACDDMSKNLELIKDLAARDGLTYEGPLKNTRYTYYQLNEEYIQWRSDYLHGTLESYNPLGTVEKKEQAESEASLDDMIGLDNAKNTLKKIQSVFQMQNELLNREITQSIPCRHMVFYGEPGTAKTTTAKLFGRIMSAHHIIARDKFIQASKSDLIGRYVGHTAFKTKSMIEKARGGILFIDEAYSLALDAGKFNQECIDILVEQMDLIKRDTIVIFAGYKDKMQEFLDMNEGLRSRIAFHVEFDKYSEDECVEILVQLAKDNHVEIAPDALEKFRAQIHKNIHYKNFGNGRFVRNLLEQSMMNMAVRLAENSPDLTKLSDKELITLTKEDVKDMDILHDAEDTRDHIGFGR